MLRNRTTSESQNSVYAEQETDELIAMLRETESLDEQGDILQYLVDTHGLDFNTGKVLSALTYSFNSVPVLTGPFSGDCLFAHIYEVM